MAGVHRGSSYGYSLWEFQVFGSFGPGGCDASNAAARLLADEKVVGWHQGRMEFGPRSLGARSIKRLRELTKDGRSLVKEEVTADEIANASDHGKASRS